MLLAFSWSDERGTYRTMWVFLLIDSSEKSFEHTFLPRRSSSPPNRQMILCFSPATSLKVTHAAAEVDQMQTQTTDRVNEMEAFPKTSGRSR